MNLDHIDITFDLETCSLETNAAVIQIAAVAWVRGADIPTMLFPNELPTFDAKIDLRSCVMDGFDFDNKTIQWWAEKPKELRDSLSSGDCYPIEEAFREFCTWINDIKEQTGASLVSLWSQGSDFDIAILRHVCHKYDITLPVSYQDFRDARTFLYEVTAGNEIMGYIWDAKSQVYDKLLPFPNEGRLAGQPHNALYDAMRTSWNVNECINLLRQR